MLRPDLDRLLDDTLCDRRLLAHPFYRRWEAGTLHPAELTAYAGQYRHFERALPEVLAGVAGALPEHSRARALVQENLDDELGVPAPHVALFDDFARALGADTAAPTSAAMAALESSYRAAVAEPVAALAMVAAYEVQAPAIAVSKAEGLRLHYGLSTRDTRFWDVHGAMDTDHASWTLDALVELGATEDVVTGAARLAADAWWSFLDEREAAAADLVAAG